MPTPKPAAPPIPSGAPSPTNREFSNDAELLRYRSKRLGLSLGLPRGREWRIDDHSSAALVMSHAPTRSRISVAILRTDAVVGRSQCEQLARTAGLVPSGVVTVLEDEALITQQTFDTHIEVALLPGQGPKSPLVGHVMAFGGFLRKCYVFAFSTEVPNADDESTLSSRLAFARTRILSGLLIDSMTTAVRPSPASVDVTRTR